MGDIAQANPKCFPILMTATTYLLENQNIQEKVTKTDSLWKRHHLKASPFDLPNVALWRETNFSISRIYFCTI